jgi:hypothetical protein
LPQIKRPKAHLKAHIDAMISANQAKIVEIMVGTQEYTMFYKLAVKPGRVKN